MPKSSLEPLHQEIHSANPASVPSGSTNDDVPSQDGIQYSNQRKSKVGMPSPTPRLLEPPPPSYDEVVSSADSSPHSGRSRASPSSEHEYPSCREHAEDSHIYEEIPESTVSAVLFITLDIESHNHMLEPNAEINITSIFFDLLSYREILIPCSHF